MKLQKKAIWLWAVWALVVGASCQTAPRSPQGLEEVKTVAVAIRTVRLEANPVKVLNLLGGPFTAVGEGGGFSRMVQFREASPDLVLDHLGFAGARALIAEALASGWRPGVEVKAVEWNDGMDPASLAQAEGTDLAVVVDVNLLVQTGRASKNRSSGAVRVDLSPKDGFAQCQARVGVEVWDNAGTKVWSLAPELAVPALGSGPEVTVFPNGGEVYILDGWVRDRLSDEVKAAVARSAAPWQRKLLP